MHQVLALCDCSDRAPKRKLAGEKCPTGWLLSLHAAAWSSATVMPLAAKLCLQLLNAARLPSLEAKPAKFSPAPALMYMSETKRRGAAHVNITAFAGLLARATPTTPGPQPNSRQVCPEECTEISSLAILCPSTEHFLQAWLLADQASTEQLPANTFGLLKMYCAMYKPAPHW